MRNIQTNRPALSGPQVQPVLIRNARIFTGTSETLLEGQDVLVSQGKISRIDRDIHADADWQVVDAAGRTLSPGFIDSHSHLMFQLSFPEALSSDEYYWAYKSTAGAETYLMSGFTSVRDVGGNVFSLKKNIDSGVLAGPRIYPSGPMITQTSGHGDMRQDWQRPWKIQEDMSILERYHMFALADGHDGVLVAAREALRRGATQIKICTTGAVGTIVDPLDVTQFLPEEVQAAVAAAQDWGTYVCSHAYHDRGILRAIDNGVKCIEHATLVSEATLKKMKDMDVWLSPQCLVYSADLPGLTAEQQARQAAAGEGLDVMMKLAKKLGYEKIAFGTDLFTGPELLSQMNQEFVMRTKWFTPFEVMRQATALSGELLAMCGRRNPYPGKLGVIEEGAHADILLIDGDPLRDIDILIQPAETLHFIMKAGVIHKDTTS